MISITGAVSLRFIASSDVTSEFFEKEQDFLYNQKQHLLMDFGQRRKPWVIKRTELQGQVNLALIGHPYVTDGGSITLTSGIIKEAFIPEGTSSALVNGAIESFVASAAFEIDRGIRINAVSPNALVGSWDAYAPSFRGFIPVGDAPVFAAYEKSVFGIMTGQTFKVW